MVIHAGTVSHATRYPVRRHPVRSHGPPCDTVSHASRYPMRHGIPCVTKCYPVRRVSRATLSQARHGIPCDAVSRARRAEAARPVHLARDDRRRDKLRQGRQRIRRPLRDQLPRSSPPLARRRNRRALSGPSRIAGGGQAPPGLPARPASAAAPSRWSQSLAD